MRYGLAEAGTGCVGRGWVGRMIWIQQPGFPSPLRSSARAPEPYQRRAHERQGQGQQIDPRPALRRHAL